MTSGRRDDQIRLLSVAHGLDHTLPLLCTRPQPSPEESQARGGEDPNASADPADANHPLSGTPPREAEQQTTGEKGNLQPKAVGSAAAGEKIAAGRASAAGDKSTAVNGAVVDGAATTPVPDEKIKSETGSESNRGDESSRGDDSWEEQVVPVSAEPFFFTCPPLSALMATPVSYRHRP